MSSFDFGVAVALGAVMGRTVLLLQPTLLTGLVAMTVLFATQAVLGALRTHRRVDRLRNRPPVLLMAGRTPLVENMRRSHVTEDELRQRIRLAGLASLDHVLAVVLERNGQVSVLRHGPVSLELFEDVFGAQALRDLVEHGRAAPTAPGSPWRGDQHGAAPTPTG
jgi:uncharacterized membrane protein YcaP (DUF421 family)